MDNLAEAQIDKPAEQALLETIAPAELKLIANWLREELALYGREYASQATRASKRIEFIAGRLDDVARQRAEADSGAIGSDGAGLPEEGEESWRFSDEYWEKYGADDD